MSGVGDIEDVGSSLGWEDPPGGKHGNPPQYSCLENPMDKEARQAMIIYISVLSMPAPIVLMGEMNLKQDHIAHEA